MPPSLLSVEYRAHVLATLDALPRTPLAHTPTPLLPAPHLAARLEYEKPLWVKADAWTGFGLGGNKVRKLEYELEPASLEGVTHLVTLGGPHSNHCRVTAAAAAALGLRCILVLNGEPQDSTRGNASLHRLHGAEIVTVDSREARSEAAARAAADVTARGGRALIVPLGASTPRGSLGYIHAARELYEQVQGRPIEIVTASSSGGTLAGLILGAAILDWPVHILAVSADDPAEHLIGSATELVHSASRLLDPSGDLEEPLASTLTRVAATDAFVGDGYGIPTPASDEAEALFAQHVGVVLDPVYTAKAAAALIAAARDRDRGPREMVFLHTGGHPARFR